MWTYEQSSGVITAADGTRLSPPGYAGNGAGKNNPTAQDQHDVGPLPCGFYTIGPAYDSPKTGPISMNLTPDESNSMFGRSGFRIHADEIEHPGYASDGCIVQSHAIRVRISLSLDTRLQVISGLVPVSDPELGT
jgi:Protein of unknown function (DUF2778)